MADQNITTQPVGKKNSDFKNFILIFNLIFLLVISVRSSFGPTFGYLLAPLVIFNISIYIVRKLRTNPSRLLRNVTLIISSFFAGIALTNLIALSALWGWPLIGLILWWAFTGNKGNKNGPEIKNN